MLLHFKLEGNYPNTGELPTPSQIRNSLKYLDNQNTRPQNIQSLALDIRYGLQREFPNLAWVNDITHVKSFYGSDKKETKRNLELRQQLYATSQYYFFSLLLLNGKFIALEFKCERQEYFNSDSDEYYLEIDV